MVINVSSGKLTDHLPTFGWTLPPKGYRDLIARSPAFARRGVRPTVAKWTPAVALAVGMTKIGIDKQFRYRLDGKEDIWNLPKLELVPGVLGPPRWLYSGDCEDLELLYADRLPIEAGAMRKVVCRLRGRGHLVMGLWTDVGTLIADLRRPIVHWRQARWLDFATDGAVEMMGWPIWKRSALK